MRKIEHTGQFKRDYRRVAVGRHRATLNTLLASVLPLLLTDQDLPVKYHDHALIGEWHDHRDCHLKPDLVLIYRKPDATTLQLVRLGSHSELGL
ncbi:type II toxin-antitoxin system YafQ family toxin [Burkholderia gladioli]|uniref:type II toxin-antitoxin system YafQ family toxin n=1 Tax=Burkholderia gladioli TaxID=28095 RepID=UPI00164123EC|nr:type II toxin-antitoxin system YafQ family toxin [Burkholderia gladioli]